MILHKLRTSKHLEEILGVVGILYFAALFALALIFVQFLVSSIDSAGKTPLSNKNLPPAFDISLGEEVTKR